MDGGIAAPAFTFSFSIPVFTLGVFSTNESLCTEVVTCGERGKGSLDVVWPETAYSKQEACTLHREQRKTEKCTNEQHWSCCPLTVEVQRKVDGCSRLETKISLLWLWAHFQSLSERQQVLNILTHISRSPQIDWLPPREATLRDQIHSWALAFRQLTLTQLKIKILKLATQWIKLFKLMLMFKWGLFPFFRDWQQSVCLLLWLFLL